MAPIAIETRRPEVVLSPGQYKELSDGPKTYVKKVEEEGTEDQPAATVRISSPGSYRVQDADASTYDSTGIIFRHGIQPRDIPRLSHSHM